MAPHGVVVGEQVFAIGHPQVMSGPPYDRLTRWSFVGGYIGGVDNDWVAADVSVYPGNSGGPLVDCTGRVVAVASHVSDDFRTLFAGRANHLVPLQAGRRPPPYRVPLLPGSTLDLGLVFGGDALGVTYGATWQSSCSWFVRLVGSTQSNALAGDIFAEGIRSQSSGALLIGLSARPFRGWHFYQVRLSAAFGVILTRQWLRHAVVAEDTIVGSTLQRSRFFSGTSVLRLHYGRWFLEPQLAFSIEEDPRFTVHVAVGLEHSF